MPKKGQPVNIPAGTPYYPNGAPASRYSSLPIGVGNNMGILSSVPGASNGPTWTGASSDGSSGASGDIWNTIQKYGALALGAISAYKNATSKPSTTPTTPADLQPMRKQQIELLQYLMGMGPDPRSGPTASAYPSAASWIPRMADGGVAGDNPAKQALRAQGYPEELISAVDELAKSGQGMATGGVARSYDGGGMVEGPGGPTDDKVPAQLSNGEGVLTAEAVKNLGGSATIAEINKVFGGPGGADAGQMIQKLFDQLAGGVPNSGTNVPTPGMPQHMAMGGVAGTLGAPLPGTGSAGVGGPPPPVLGGTPLPKMGGLGQLPNADANTAQGQNATQSALGTGVEMAFPAPMQPVSRAPQGTFAGLIAGMAPPHRQAPQMMAGGGVAGSPAVLPMTPDNPPPVVSPGQNLPNDPGLPLTPPPSNGVQTPQQRLESFYGPLGMYASPLQQQSSGAMSQYLNQMSPEQRTLGVAQPALEATMNGGSPTTQNAINSMMGLTTGPSANVAQGLGNAGNRPQTGSVEGDAALQRIMTGQSGNNLAGMGQVQQQGALGGDSAAQGILQALAGQNSGEAVVRALQPQYEHNLALANMVGGRFGSGNALQREAALNDYNTNATNAMQRGVDQQITAGNSLGNIDVGFNTNQATARGQNNQAAIQSAINQLAGGTTGLNAQLSALGLGQTGQQGLDDATIRALSSLGGLQAQGQGQAGTNAANAANASIANQNSGTNAANVLGGLASNAGQSTLAGINQGFNQGVTQTNQGYTGQQNTINLLNQLLGTAQGASMGGGTIQNQPAGQSYSDLAQLLAALGRSGGQGNNYSYSPATGGA